MGSGVDCFGVLSNRAGESVCGISGGEDGRRLEIGSVGRVCDFDVRVASRDIELRRVDADVDALLSKAPRLDRAKLASFDCFPLLPVPDEDPPSNPHRSHPRLEVGRIHTDGWITGFMSVIGQPVPSNVSMTSPAGSPGQTSFRNFMFMA